MEYKVEGRCTDSLSSDELERCCAVVKCGGAVNPKSAQAEIPKATALVVAQAGNEIVGVGVIKRPRQKYAASVAAKSGYGFDPKTLELGYVAVEKAHGNNKLSKRIVAKLLSGFQGPLFATTDSEFMKSTLRKAGFKEKGNGRAGQRGQRSRWLKD